MQTGPRSHTGSVPVLPQTSLEGALSPRSQSCFETPLNPDTLGALLPPSRGLRAGLLLDERRDSHQGLNGGAWDAARFCSAPWVSRVRTFCLGSPSRQP